MALAHPASEAAQGEARALAPVGAPALALPLALAEDRISVFFPPGAVEDRISVFFPLGEAEDHSAASALPEAAERSADFREAFFLLAEAASALPAADRSAAYLAVFALPEARFSASFRHYLHYFRFP